MLSVIIPSRVDQYLQKTVDDLLANAEGSIEVIVILDGYWASPMLKDDERVIVVHQGTFFDNFGMRAAINAGVSIARGEYIMKIDEHCMVDKGFDVKLIADCEDDWMVVPRRYRLDADNWSIVQDGRPPIDYMVIDYPYKGVENLKEGEFLPKTEGLHGAKYDQMHYDRKDILIDDLMTMQGSCWFMPKKLWDRLIVRMEDEKYGTFTMEAQELSNKVWLSGGRVVVNKKTWYAHLHKGKKGKGYGFNNAQWRKHEESKEKGRLYAMDFWLNDKWEDRVHDFEWLIEKFSPLPGWKDTWKTDIIEDRKKDYSMQGYKNDTWLINLREQYDANRDL